MKEKSCCFSGHRVITGSLEQIVGVLTAEIKKAIESGFENFIFGGAAGFDTEAAYTVLKLKKEYPNIKLIAYIPYRDYLQRLEKKNERYILNAILKADKIEFIAEHYFRGCMQMRNRKMADDSKSIICYLRKNSGGTFYTFNYAVKSGLEVVKI